MRSSLCYLHVSSSIMDAQSMISDVSPELYTWTPTATRHTCTGVPLWLGYLTYRLQLFGLILSLFLFRYDYSISYSTSLTRCAFYR